MTTSRPHVQGHPSWGCGKPRTREQHKCEINCYGIIIIIIIIIMKASSLSLLPSLLPSFFL